MQAKTVEIRDKATFIPALAIRLDPTTEADRYLFARAGFGRTPEAQREYVVLVKINGGHGDSSCDPYDWDTRTMQVAHKQLLDNWGAIVSGDVIDVEFITGETNEPKRSEAHEASL